LRGLGPAGAAAAGAMGIISRGASSMGKQMAATQITIQGVTTALRTLALATPAAVVVLAAAAAGGLARFAKASVETATSLDTLRVQTGMTAESLQEYGYAAEQSGISMDRFGSLMGSLQRRMGRAADGNERYAQAFAELGVNLRDSEGNLRGIDDVLPEIADGFARVTDETDRARLATTIMNNAGMELLPML